VGHGPLLQAQVPLCLAVTGGEFDIRVDETRVPAWRRIHLAAGATLHIGRAARGYRGYLAVSGGFDSPLVLDSCSTLLVAQMGGHQGRALRAGDRLKSGPCGDELAADERPAKRATAWSSWAINPAALGYSVDSPAPMRVLEGRHFARFAAKAREAFLTQAFRIGAQANRMGFRLEGAWVEPPAGFEAISEPVTHGTIQVPPSGEPIVLLADRPTVGGYPYLATVAAVDLPRLAQLPPGSLIRFEAISVYEAQARYLSREGALTRLESAIAEKQMATAHHAAAPSLVMDP